MNGAQQAQYQREPSIKERFEFKPISQFSRAIFIAAPHQGTQYADRWFTKSHVKSSDCRMIFIQL
jgi:hypothetical protein